MARTRVGLDIGSTAARVAEVVPGDVPVLVRAAQVPLPAGAVEMGEVKQPDVVAAALKELWRLSGIKGRRVQVGVANQRVVVREVTLPWLPEKELRASLPFQVQEFIPMPVEEAVLDFDPLDDTEQGGRRVLRILLAAAYKPMIDALVEAVLGAKLDPVGIDLSPFALVRAVGTQDGALEVEQAGNEAIIDVGAHVTVVCVHDRGVTRFVRILPTGGRDLTLALARALGVEEDVAEQLKRGIEVDGAPGREDVRRIVATRLAAFVDEVRSSLEFYAAQVSGARIARVLAVGGGSKLEGFMEALEQRIPVPVDRGRLLDRVKSELDQTPEAVSEIEPVLPVAVGLAISGRRRS